MLNQVYSYLNFVDFFQINLWDCKKYAAKEIYSSYKIVKLSDYIKDENKKIKPFETPDQDFEILGVNNKTGLFDAYIEKGEKINQPYKIVEDSFLAYNPYRINVGSIGLKTSAQRYKYISPAYVVFSCKEGLLPEFLYILFRTEKFNELIRENTTGSVRQTLSFTSMGNIKIPLPSIEKQKAMVDKYEQKLTEARQQEQQAVQLEQNIEEYILQELDVNLPKLQSKKTELQFINYQDIGRWDYDCNNFLAQGVLVFNSKYNVVKFSTIVKSYQYGTSSKAIEQKKGIPVLRMNNIFQSELNSTDLKFINSLSSKEIETLQLSKGDILFNRTNSKELVGKTCVYDIDGLYVFASYIIRIKLDEKRANPYFINYLFNSSIVRNQIDATSRQVTCQANINTDELDGFKIPLPPIEIQNKIVEQVMKFKQEAKSLRLLANINKQMSKEEFMQELFQ